ncbi:MAG: tetratricopeptide repeat protein [Euryarchaeota archaeon]|nr:tetratricopeptide repeat protein [Euryarchaeota archaeon]MDE1879107.1 tetratricopeptide repeat protein [Euryarchaeota archaeon]
MASRRFATLVDAVARAFGQEGNQLKETPEAIYLRSSDGLVYAFFEEAQRLSPALIKKLVASMGEDMSRLVVLSLGPLPPDSMALFEQAGSSVVAGDRFQRLLEGLELSGYGDLSGPSPPVREETPRRVLPTADRLDQLMERGRLWMGWDVPAIALRFFDEATRLKPEFAPALLGRGMALIALGAADSAESSFERVLSQSPGDEEARVGLARVTGLRGDPEGEVDELLALLKENPGRSRVRAHLLAALAPLGRWKEMRSHVDEFLRVVPQDPYLHALNALCLERLSDKDGAVRERRAAEVLGMTPQLWQRLRASVEPAATAPRGAKGPKGDARARSSSSAKR